MPAQGFLRPLNAWASDLRALGMAYRVPLGPTAGRLGPLSVRSSGAYEVQLHFSTQGCVEKAKDGVSLGDLCSLPS